MLHSYIRNWLIVSLILVSHASWSASFTPLGTGPGAGYSKTFAISNDGTTVVGQKSSFLGPEAFRWTSAGGLVGLGDLPDGNFSSLAFGVSGDGSVVAGVGDSDLYEEAFRWTSGGGMVGLGDLPGGLERSRGFGISADGATVVGRSYSTSGQEAFRWTAGTGIVGLGDLTGGEFRSLAYAASADGSVVVGYGNIVAENFGIPPVYEAFRWTSGTGMVGLGDLPGGDVDSYAYAVSSDGTVVVGSSDSTSGGEAMRWTAAGGMVGLGDLPGGSFASYATGVSDDGNVVVGWSVNSGSGSSTVLAPFVWTAATGMQELEDILIAGGATGLTGWSLDVGPGSNGNVVISGDGQWVAATGVNPSGKQEAYLAYIGVEVPIQIESANAGGNIHPHHDGGPEAIAGLNDDIAVVVLGSSISGGDPIDFNTDDIDADTLRFGPGLGATDPASTHEFGIDVNSDGDLDARFHFLTGDADIACSDTEATLTGETIGGQSFQGTGGLTTACNAQCH
jgi:probable HAF family extracellular repeat protein